MFRLQLLRNKLAVKLIVWGKRLLADTHDSESSNTTSLAPAEYLNNAPPQHWLDLVRKKAPHYYNNLQQRGAASETSLKHNDNLLTPTDTTVGSVLEELNDNTPRKRGKATDERSVGHYGEKSDLISSKARERHTTPLWVAGVSARRDIDNINTPEKINTPCNAIENPSVLRARERAGNSVQISAEQSPEAVAEALIPSDGREANTLVSTSGNTSEWPELSSNVLNKNSEEKYPSAPVNPVKSALSPDKPAVPTVYILPSQHSPQQTSHTPPVAKPIMPATPNNSRSPLIVTHVVSESSATHVQDQCPSSTQQMAKPLIVNSPDNNIVNSKSERGRPVSDDVNKIKPIHKDTRVKVDIVSIEQASLHENHTVSPPYLQVSWPEILSAADVAATDEWPPLLADVDVIQTVHDSRSDSADLRTEPNALQRRADRERTGDLWNV